MSGERLSDHSWWNRYRGELETCDTHELEVFLRSPAPTVGTHKNRIQVLERLEEIAARGLVDDYEMTVLGNKLCLCKTCSETLLSRELLEKIDELRGLGDGTWEYLSFRKRRVDSSVSDEHYAVLVPPETAIAARVDGEVCGVFPSSVDGVQYHPMDFLEALATENHTRRRSTVRTRVEPSPSRF